MKWAGEFVPEEHGGDCLASKHGLCRNFTWKRERKLGEPRATSRGQTAGEAGIPRGLITRQKKKGRPGALARKERSGRGPCRASKEGKGRRGVDHVGRKKRNNSMLSLGTMWQAGTAG